LLLFITSITYQDAKAQTNNEVFTGAEVNLKHYNALYILDDKDDKKIRVTSRNINNALEEPRLKGKITIELIAFGDGVEVYKKTNPYDSLLTALKQKGVILAQCSNTMRERHITKDELWPYISFVPSGNGEIIIRH
jgi:intracellular sulfur oxidation DsrE/DsrF family protein